MLFRSGDLGRGAINRMLSDGTVLQTAMIDEGRRQEDVQRTQRGLALTDSQMFWSDRDGNLFESALDLPWRDVVVEGDDSVGTLVSAVTTVQRGPVLKSVGSYVYWTTKKSIRRSKIEGRLKGPEYVALTTQVYRQAVDRAWAAMENSPDAIPAALKDTPFLTREAEIGRASCRERV